MISESRIMLKDLDPRNGGFGVPLVALLFGAVLLGLVVMLAPGGGTRVADTPGTTVGSSTHSAPHASPTAPAVPSASE